MSSNLKVNTILPSTGSNIGIGTNGGELNVDGGCKVQVGTALTLGHSIGLQYATQNLHSTGFEINQINASGIITASHFYGNGANLTALNIVTDTSPQLGADLSSNGHHIVITDGEELRLGDDHDTKIRFNGSKSQIVSSVQFDIDADIIDFHNASASVMKARFLNNQVELYHNNVKRFETDSNGVRVVAPEGARAELRIIGDEGDDNNDYFKLSAGEGTLKLQDASNGSSWEDNIVINAAGSVELYYNNTKRIETTDGAMNVSQGTSTFCNFHHDGGHSGIRIAGPSASSGANLVFANNYDNSNSDEWAIHLDGATDDLVFKEGGAQGTNRVRFLDSGGICFGTDTATANALDDYEEGSWSPLWSNSASNSGGTTTSNNMYGRYTKIGKMVHAYFYTWGLPSGNSGNMYLQGLPFSCASNPGAFFCAVQSAFYNMGADNYYNLGLRLSTNRTFAELIFCRKDPGNYVPAEFSGFINYYTNFNGVLTYEAA